MATVTVPVTIAEEAATRVAELGMQSELDRMLEHTKQAVPGLRSIEVTLEYDYEEIDRGPIITLWCHRNDPGPIRDLTNWNWGAWFVETFPPEVCEHFVMLSCYENSDGR